MMAKFKLLVFGYVLSFSAFLFSANSPEFYYCDLNRNVELIISFIKDDKIFSLFRPEDQQVVRLALKNSSPADFTLQIELNNTIIPVLFYFHKGELGSNDKVILNTFAKKHSTEFKMIVVDVDELYTFKQEAIKSFPTAMIVAGQEKIQVSNGIDQKNIAEGLEKLIANFREKLPTKNK